MNDSIRARLFELFPTQAEEICSLFELEKLSAYYKFLQDYNEIGGFFSKSDSENILDRHIIESIIHVFTILKHSPISRETKLADIGTGPGLPGYIFSTLKNSPNITLVDSQKRRLGLLKDFHSKLYPSVKINFIYDRVENIKQKFDLVVMRSAVPYPWSVEMVCKLLNKNSQFIPFLGRRSYSETLEVELNNNLGFKIEKEIDLIELEFLGMRHIKILKKTDESKKGFPRTWEIISKEMKRKSWEK